MEAVYRVYTTEESLSQPVHDAGGSPEYFFRRYRAVQDRFIVCDRNAAAFPVGNAAAKASSEDATRRQRRASPFYRRDEIISAYASRLATATAAAPPPSDHREAWPLSRDAEEDRESATDAATPPCLISAHAPRLAAAAAPAPRDHHAAEEDREGSTDAPAPRDHRAAEEDREGATVAPAPRDHHAAEEDREGDTDAPAPPSYCDDCLIPPYAPGFAPTEAWPRSHAHLAAEEERERSTLWASNQHAGAGHGADDSCDGGTSDTKDTRHVGDLRAASDIRLVQQRTSGVAPSWLHTILRVPCRYWISAVKRWIIEKIFRRFQADVPLEWSWVSIMGPAVYQPHRHGKADGSCVICACAVCIHAQHRLAFERRYGPGSFPFELSPVDYLKRACERTGTWRPWGDYGTDPQSVIKDELPQGLRTKSVPGWRPCYLPFRRFFEFNKDDLSPLDAAGLIRQFGPVVATLRVNKSYSRDSWDDQYVYPGEKGVPNHAVVCVHYSFHNKKLHLLVLENARHDGPYIWVLFDAFARFCFIRVDALDREALVLTNPPPSRLRNMFSFWK